MDRELLDTHNRNFQAEMAHETVKQENKERYEVTKTYDDGEDEIVITETVYGSR